MYISILGRNLDGSYVTLLRDGLRKENVLLRNCRFSELDTLGFIEKIVFGKDSEVVFNGVENYMAKTLLVAFEGYNLPIAISSSRIVEVLEGDKSLNVMICLEYYDSDEEVLSVSYS